MRHPQPHRRASHNREEHRHAARRRAGRESRTAAHAGECAQRIAGLDRGSIGWGAYTLRDDANSLIESLPEAARKVRESIRSPRNQPESNFDKMQKAATQLEQAAAEATPRGAW